MLYDFNENVRMQPVGKVFTTEEVMGDSKSAASANRLLSIMVDAGVLRRAGRGRYYKPEESEFGEIPVDTRELVKDLLVRDGSPIAYISGLNAMNELGLTTQVPADITIACMNEKKAIVRGHVRIRFVKQANTITRGNIPLLRILDCLRFIKNIPDSDVNGAFSKLLKLIGELTDAQRVQMVRLASRYTPQVRALVGAIMEQYYPEVDVKKLRKMQNGLTTYQLGISEDLLSNQSKWRIK